MGRLNELELENKKLRELSEGLKQENIALKESLESKDEEILQLVSLLDV